VNKVLTGTVHLGARHCHSDSPEGCAYLHQDTLANFLGADQW
ncbi:uncharacterized protein METZ01_LOCUS143251, partial [marine metagenome]